MKIYKFEEIRSKVFVTVVEAENIEEATKKAKQADWNEVEDSDEIVRTEAYVGMSNNVPVEIERPEGMSDDKWEDARIDAQERIDEWNSIES